MNAILVALLGMVCTLQTPGTRQNSVEVMEIVATRFSELETALSRGDPGAILTSADHLQGVLPRIAELASVGASAEDQAAFLAYPRRLGSLAKEIAVLTNQERLDGASQAFEALRNTCVSCHVRHRSRNDVIGLFPERHNTITGVVEARDVDGQSQVNRPALVFLERVGRPEDYVHKRDNSTLAQKDLQFSSTILPIVRGTTVEFPNDDSVLHNVFSLSVAAPFDLGIYRQGTSRSVDMQQTGLVRVYCNLHPEMAASIVVLANPHFALTDNDGGYVIAGVPDGKYVVRAWNDRQAEGSQPIEIEGSEVVEVFFDIQDKLRPVQHKNKFGRRYPEKY